AVRLAVAPAVAPAVAAARLVVFPLVPELSHKSSPPLFVPASPSASCDARPMPWTARRATGPAGKFRHALPQFVHGRIGEPVSNRAAAVAWHGYCSTQVDIVASERYVMHNALTVLAAIA